MAGQLRIEYAEAAYDDGPGNLDFRRYQFREFNLFSSGSFRKTGPAQF